MFGFERFAMAVPRLSLADPAVNFGRITEIAVKAERKSAGIVLFPELSLTGYSCGDLFHQTVLLDAAESKLAELAKWSRLHSLILVVGLPVRWKNAIYNCAAVVAQGNICGLIPKSYLPNYREFYEKRWFASGLAISNELIFCAGQQVPFGTDLIFSPGGEFSFGIEICEDLWAPVPPSSQLALNGAHVILNLSASNELVGKGEYRNALVTQQSARLIAGYLYVSAGTGESTTDTVFGGHVIAAENGTVIYESDRFDEDDLLTYVDLDCHKLAALRCSESVFADVPRSPCREIKLPPTEGIKNIQRKIDPSPFVPAEAAKRDARCHEIFNIQAVALARRLSHTGVKTAVLGLSGGLDSTLALLVTERAFEILDWKLKDIITVSMPGFGTSSRTRQNAADLADSIGVTFREINIVESCLHHFSDISHDPEDLDVTYENVQARERTQVLMDIANKLRGLVIGTGDLSEIALGWSTYNADHMSMYNVNCGVPKTLVRYLVQWCAVNGTKSMRDTLFDILETPVSPELLPNKKDGSISQCTELIIGPYELHDFFLYHALRYGAPPGKILALAQIAFEDRYKTAFIKETLKTFWRRFFQNQFKRSCMPDGPKVGTIALSPRADWRMPSDADVDLWLSDV